MIPEDEKEEIINAQIIKNYLEKCGHKYQLQEIKDKITICGEKLGMNNLNGDLNIDFELFKDFMLSFLPEEEI